MANWNILPQDNDTFFNISERLRSFAGKGTSDENDIEHKDLVSSLSDMSLLYDIPFAYLVPSRKLLGDNELRFFCLDSNWIRIMLDGAFSIGRNATIDNKNDVTFLENICRNAFLRNDDVRRKLQRKPLKSQVNAMSDEPIPVCTGFLLKSEIVNGWRGLEFKAYGDITDVTNILTPLRIETLSPDILIGIFRGTIKRLEIKEPPEGFHYGFKRIVIDGKTILRKSMRSLKDGKLVYKEKNTIEIDIAERNNRVINFMKTAQHFTKCKDVFPDGADVNSAHFALEMIQNPYLIQVTEEKSNK